MSGLNQTKRNKQELEEYRIRQCDINRTENMKKPAVVAKSREARRLELQRKAAAMIAERERLFGPVDESLRRKFMHAAKYWPIGYGGKWRRD